MGVDSNFGAPSQRPGVCTSTTRPASPYVGQMIFETDTNRLAVYNGTSWIMLADADTPPGLELVKTHTIGTAVSSIAVTGAFSSTYDNYLITINGGVASTDLTLRLQIGSATTGYYGAFTGAGINGTSQVAGINNAANVTYAGYGDSTNLVMNCHVYGPNLGRRTYVTAHVTRDNTSNQPWGQTVCQLADNTAFTGFTVLTSTGTVTGGTIRVYGYRNS